MFLQRLCTLTTTTKCKTESVGCETTTIGRKRPVEALPTFPRLLGHAFSLLPLQALSRHAYKGACILSTLALRSRAFFTRKYHK